MKLTSRLLQNRKQKNLNEEPKEKKQDKLRILVVSSGALKSKKDKTPIFIVGLPRSGTTLTEQILASHSDVFGAGEVNYLDEIIPKAFNAFFKFSMDYSR